MWRIPSKPRLHPLPPSFTFGLPANLAMLRISLRESSEETYLDSFMLDDEQDSGRNDHLPWFIDTTTPTTWTKAQVRRRVTCLALSLQAEFQLGLDHSDSRTPRGYLNEVVAFISPNDIDYAVCVWAVHRLGCAVACCNGTGTSSELAHQFRLAKPTLLVVHPSALDHAVAAAVAYGISSERVVVLSRTSICSERLTTEALINRGEHLVTVGAPIQRAPSHGLDPVAFLCFSSGTTGTSLTLNTLRRWRAHIYSGLPKAVLVPHRAVIANVLQVRDSSIPRVRAAPGDRALGVIPFSHMYGLLMLVHVCPSLGIATVVYPSLPRPFDSFLASLTTHRVNHLFLAPPLVHAFVKHPASATSVFSHFKTALVAAAPLNGLTEDTFRRMCPEGFLIAQVFGMTETAGIITAVPEGGAPRAGSVGHMITATEGKVVTEDGAIVRFSRESPPDVAVRGELRARGPELCLGYLDNDLATAEAFDEEGYIRTGDIVEVTKDGNVTIVDRAKHIIKSKVRPTTVLRDLRTDLLSNRASRSVPLS
jgi:4-coumarate--CoA ligase